MKVILLGSFAGNNAGDMVVLESIINDFNNFIIKGTENPKISLFEGMEREKEIKLIIPALNEKGMKFINSVIECQSCMELVSVPINRNPYNILNIVKKLIKEFSSADYIYTTAGILFDYKIWNPLYNFVIAYTPLLMWAKHVNPDVNIIGYNIGITSKSHAIGRLLLNKCVSLHDRIYLREEKDSILLKKLQYKGTVFISADNVFGYNEPTIQENLDKEKKKMYINLTLYGVQNRKLFFYEIIKFVNLVKQKYDIYFFQTSSRDLEVAKIVCEKTLLEENRINYLGLMGYNKIQELLIECDLLIGMRMHSIIFALKRCCPVIAICYSQKVMSLMNTMHLEKLIVTMNEITTEKLVSKVDMIANQKKLIISQIYDETKKAYLMCNKYK